MKLLVVDDEEQIREGIKRFICTLDLPVAEIKTASDGQEALAIINDYCPDIVLSDVVMPGMDGIQLIRKIKEKNKEIKAIMISGYTDLSYLKSAFKVDAIDYILKPVNIGELESVLTKTIKDIEERKIEQINKDTIRKKYDESLPLLRSKFLSDLINGAYSKFDDVSDKADSLGFIMTCEMKHIVMTVTIEDWEPSVQTEVIDMIESMLNESGTFRDAFIFELHENEIVIVMFFRSTNIVTGSINEFTEHLMKKVRMNFGTDLSVGVSNPGNELLDLAGSYKQAAEAVKQSFILGMGSVVHYMDVCERDELNLVLTNDLEKRLISLIYTGDTEGIDSFLSAMFTEYSSQNFKVTGQKVLQIKVSLIGFIYKLLNDMDIDIGEKYSGTDWSKFTQLETLESIRKWIEELLSDICKNTCQMRKSKSEIMVAKIKEIIHDKYGKPIGIQDVADELGISNNYLSAIFKQSTGISFTRYLTKVRLDKAKALIDDSLLKIQDISFMVGYEDQNYFARVFRREYGVSPSEMREIRQ